MVEEDDGPGFRLHWRCKTIYIPSIAYGCGTSCGAYHILGAPRVRVGKLKQYNSNSQHGRRNKIYIGKLFTSE